MQGDEELGLYETQSDIEYLREVNKTWNDIKYRELLDKKSILLTQIKEIDLKLQTLEQKNVKIGNSKNYPRPYKIKQRWIKNQYNKETQYPIVFVKNAYNMNYKRVKKDEWFKLIKYGYLQPDKKLRDWLIKYGYENVTQTLLR